MSWPSFVCSGAKRMQEGIMFEFSPASKRMTMQNVPRAIRPPISSRFADSKRPLLASLECITSVKNVSGLFAWKLKSFSRDSVGGADEDVESGRRCWLDGRFASFTCDTFNCFAPALFPSSRKRFYYQQCVQDEIVSIFSSFSCLHGLIVHL